MDTVHDLLWTMYIDGFAHPMRQAVTIDGHVSRNIVVDNVYRLSVSPEWPQYTLYCCQVSDAIVADNTGIYR